MDAISAIEKFSDLERGDGELAFPEVGTLLALTQVQLVARINRDKAAKEQMLVRWRCPECGVYRSGFVHQQDHEPRICRGVPLEGSGICGAVMQETERQRAA